MFFILLLLWIIFSGKITLEILIVGVVVSLIVTLFINKFFYKEESNFKHPIRNAFLLIEYFFILIIEIIKANIGVFSIILKKDLEFDPCFCYFKTDLKESKHKILLANSITLTPGTITVSLNENGEYKVHCLDKSMADGIDTSIFVQMLKKMEED